MLRRRRAIVVAAFLVACSAAVPFAADRVPPLGVSMNEAPRESSTDVAITNNAKLTRVDECTLPDFIANDAAGPTVIEDVSYGEDKREKYDLVLPEQPMPRALVVIVHGGGWTSGGKGLYRSTIRMLGTLGYAAASVGYRLAADSARAFPAGLADVRCAIRAAAARVGVEKIIVLGASAGGHLAALVAVAPDAPQWDRDCADKRPLHIAGAILYYAPLEIDRAPERYIPIMRQAVDELLFGAKTYKDLDGGIDEDASDWLFRAREATPRYAITSGAPPMLLLNGDVDTIVPIADAHDFAAALEHAGVPHLLVELPDQGHGFPVLGHKAALKPASCTTLHFLEQIAGR